MPAAPLDRHATDGRTESERFGRPDAPWRQRLHAIVFESDTAAGRAFDITVIVAILLSVVVVVLDSMSEVRAAWRPWLDRAEWVFTALFTAEYLARLIGVRRQLRYAVSFYGVIDLLSVLPSYLAVFMPGTQLLLAVRVLRLLRVFRIFKLTAYLAESSALGAALVASRRKILVFLGFVLLMVLVMGTVLYVVEGPQNGFTSIPVSMYWAVTTMTTVGFGDITPKTDLGRLVASAMMLLGWGVLAVPTGIVTVEIGEQRRRAELGRGTCGQCGLVGHEADARYCRRCGGKLGDGLTGEAP
jgi:voltage-gated potassium channel